jgi:hypothetical protein
MRKLSTAIFAAILIAGCRSHSLHDRLNGTWVSELSTITIDFPNHDYRGSGLGESWVEHDLEVVSEKDNIVRFKEGGHVIMCQIGDDGSIILTKEGTGSQAGMPLLFHRFSK